MGMGMAIGDLVAALRSRVERNRTVAEAHGDEQMRRDARVRADAYRTARLDVEAYARAQGERGAS